MTIPPIFTGEKTPQAWDRRRRELLDLFSQNVYGATPEIRLDKTSCTTPWVLDLSDGVRYETHRLFFAKGQAFCSMRFELFSVPSDHPLPLILMIDVFDSSPDNIDHPQLSESLKRRLPYPEITRQGYAVAVVHTNDLCNDCPRTYTRGIMDIAPREGEHGWGTIGAWAWGVSPRCGSRVE